MTDGYMIRGSTDMLDLHKLLKVFDLNPKGLSLENIEFTKDQTLIVYRSGSNNVTMSLTKTGSVEFPLVNFGDRRETLIRFTYDEIMKILDLPGMSLEDIKRCFETEYVRKLEEHKP